MKGHSTSLVIVNTTVASKAEAKSMAHRIIASRLAACVQCFPIHSVYRWQGKVESSAEYLVLAKTRAAHASALMAFIKRHHAYEVPEILVTPVLDAFAKYREWIEKETNTISILAHRTHGRRRKDERKIVK